MTQSKTYVESLPGKYEMMIFTFDILRSVEPPSDLNEYLSSRAINEHVQGDPQPVSAPATNLDDLDHGNSSMITT